MKLNKYLADCGITSRRGADKLILQRRVKLNGRVVAELGRSIDPGRVKVSVDNKAVKPGNNTKVFLFNKPKGILSTTKRGKERGQDLNKFIQGQSRLFIAGRLDKDSTGLLVLTNDGDLALRITHPRYGHEKEYVVSTQEEITGRQLKRLEKGVTINGVRHSAQKILQTNKHEFHITLLEGKKHQIKRMAAAVKLTVTSLKRIRIGKAGLGNLKIGQLREITRKDIGI
jgi:23S rRNA pseudouridine2604 synthase